MALQVGRGGVRALVWGGEDMRQHRRLSSQGSEGAAAGVAPSWPMAAAAALIPGNRSVSRKKRERGGPVGLEG
jgi:hypothetical protein